MGSLLRGTKTGVAPDPGEPRPHPNEILSAKWLRRLLLPSILVVHIRFWPDRSSPMPLRLQPVSSVPEERARVARAAFPQSNTYLTLREQFGTVFADDDFADLYPTQGQPAE